MKDEEKLKPLKDCPFCGHKALLDHASLTEKVYCSNRQCVMHKAYIIPAEWQTRHAEKLVALDKVKIYHLIKKYFLMIPGDDRPTNIIHDNELDNACDEILARFGSVPVMPVVEWPPEDKCPEHWQEHIHGCKSCLFADTRNVARIQCIQAFNKAVQNHTAHTGEMVKPESVNQRLVEALEVLKDEIDVGKVSLKTFNLINRALEEAKR